MVPALMREQQKKGILSDGPLFYSYELSVALPLPYGRTLPYGKTLPYGRTAIESAITNSATVSTIPTTNR